MSFSRGPQWLYAILVTDSVAGKPFGNCFRIERVDQEANAAATMSAASAWIRARWAGPWNDSA
jgi:hypothetical protein